MPEKQNQAQTDPHQVNVLQKLHKTVSSVTARPWFEHTHTDCDLHEFMI